MVALIHRLGLVVIFVSIATLLIPSFYKAIEPEEEECSKYASPAGSDSAPGTERGPFQSVQQLVDSLSAGQTGCLMSGTYGDPDNLIEVSKGGTESARVVIRSAPSEQAKVHARLWIAQGANYITVRDLILDGSSNSKPSPTINGDYVRFVGNEVTNRHRSESCFIVGRPQQVIVTGTVIKNNRIHDCGRLPRTNHDHGIYLSAARDTEIVRNWIYDNADRGIQLYPDAQRTVIKHNVIDGNGQGVIFSGDDGKASSDTTVTNNLITNSKVRYNVESWYPAGNPVGERNVVVKNCIHSGAKGNIEELSSGYTAYDNLAEEPMYKDRESGNFALLEGSPCSNLLAG